MSQNMAPPIPSLVPETAPFSDEQRAWLNGFFAGMISLDGTGVTALSPEQSAALMPGALNAFGDADDDEAPWHDQTLPLPERMKLAEGKPLRHPPRTPPHSAARATTPCPPPSCRATS